MSNRNGSADANASFPFPNMDTIQHVNLYKWVLPFVIIFLIIFPSQNCRNNTIYSRTCLLWDISIEKSNLGFKHFKFIHILIHEIYKAI